MKYIKYAVEILIVFFVIAIIYFVTSKFTEFEPSELADNADKIVGGVKSWLNA